MLLLIHKDCKGREEKEEKKATRKAGRPLEA